MHGGVRRFWFGLLGGPSKAGTSSYIVYSNYSGYNDNKKQKGGGDVYRGRRRPAIWSATCRRRCQMAKAQGGLSIDRHKLCFPLLAATHRDVRHGLD
jgi:hypothetical protein